MFENALGQFIANRPPKHEISSTNYKTVILFNRPNNYYCGITVYV